jgi:preprotein translocase subunit SecE
MASKVTDTNSASTKMESPKPAGGPKPASAARKDGTIPRISRYLKEVQVELRKTTWPTRQELTNSTKVVLGTVIVVGVYLGVIDWLLTRVTHALGFFK